MEDLASILIASMLETEYQLVAVDLDWTLLNRQKSIGPRSVRAINDALDAGCEVIFCTGRSRCQFEKYLAPFPRLRYVVSSSGAVVYDVTTWEKLISNELPVSVVSKILRVGETLDCFPFMAVDGKTVYPAAMAPLAKEYGLEHYIYEMENFATGVEDVFRWYRNAPRVAESVAFYFRNHKPCAQVRSALQDLPLYMSFPREPCVEISLNTADKGKALTALCDRLNIPMSHTMVIGDSDNDIPMFQVAGLAVAMENALPTVKQCADVVTLDCNSDGVGTAIERYVLCHG